MAAGEVRISGVIEPAEVTLISPLQSEACVYYRARIGSEGDRSEIETDRGEERAIGFRVRDPSGDIRVFPRGARWDAPLRLDESSGAFDGEPVGLRVRRGSPIGQASADRASQVEALLTVHPVEPLDEAFRRGSQTRQRRYREWRLAPGDTVTVIGRSMPFADLSDPAEADFALGGDVPPDDPEVAADMAEARAAGRLADDPAEAWGNAAIPGFGIGRPVRPPA
ncbi:MAG: hypothetical protein H0U58_06330, partial [Chloroflexi bacterium]|nr:hypothetical protein [Chloroflexota bacterium]